MEKALEKILNKNLKYKKHDTKTTSGKDITIYSNLKWDEDIEKELKQYFYSIFTSSKKQEEYYYITEKDGTVTELPFPIGLDFFIQYPYMSYDLLKVAVHPETRKYVDYFKSLEKEGYTKEEIKEMVNHVISICRITKKGG